MTGLLVALYVTSALFEAAGVVIAAIEIRNARRMWTERINAPARPEEGPAYGLARAQVGLEELFVGGRRRRVWGVALLLSGLAFGAIGNLVSLAA